MPKKSFRDPNTNVLKAWGYMSSNQPGDLVRDELDDFNLEPGRWQWNGSQWIPFTSIPPPPSPFRMAIDALIADPATPQKVKNAFIQMKNYFNVQ